MFVWGWCSRHILSRPIWFILTHTIWTFLVSSDFTYPDSYQLDISCLVPFYLSWLVSIGHILSRRFYLSWLVSIIGHTLSRPILLIPTRINWTYLVERDIREGYKFHRIFQERVHLRELSFSRVAEIKIQRKLTEACPLYLIKQVRRAVSKANSSVLHFVWCKKYWKNVEKN